MARLSNNACVHGFNFVSRIDLDSLNEISGNTAQTFRLFSGSNGRLRSAVLFCPDNLTCGGNTILAKLGDSTSGATFIPSTTISGLGDDAGIVASAEISEAPTYTKTSVFNRIVSNPGLEIDTNFDIKAANAFDAVSSGLLYTVAADTSFDTGTTAVIPADKWGVAVLSMDLPSTAYVNWHVNYDTESEAIAAAKASTDDVDGGSFIVGFVTVKTAAGVVWTAGTDALEGGTGGDVSSETNYYNYSAVDEFWLSNMTSVVSGLNSVTNGIAIADYVDLTVSLNTGEWSANNGGSFFVFMDIATPDQLV